MTLILLVGVSPETGKWLEARLPGLKVEASESASQVISRLERESVQLILLEHDLPGQTGLEFLVQLRADGVTIPPVFYCLPDLGDFALSFRLIQDFSVKQLLIHPVEPEDLVFRLRTFLQFDPATQPPLQIQGRLKELWEKHFAGLLKQARALAEVTEKELEDEDRRAYLVKCAHQLAGSVATFGFPNASEMARLLEHSLQDGNPAAESVQAQGAAILQMLQGRDRMLATRDTELWDERLAILQTLALQRLGGPLTDAQLQAGLAEAGKMRLAASLLGIPPLISALAAVEETLLRNSAGCELAEGVLSLQTELRRRGARLRPRWPAGKVWLGGEAHAVQQDLALTFRLSGFEVGQGPLSELSGVEMGAFFILEYRPESSREFYQALEQLRHRAQSVIVYGQEATSSEFGVRACFDMPLDCNQLVDFVKDLSRLQGQSGQRVLAMDDDPAILGILASTLREAGFQFAGEREPLLFWQRLQEVNPDLLILDLEMPRLSGLELCKLVRSHPRYSSLPIVFLTAGRDADVIEGLLRAGADDHVLKPVVGNELSRCIEDHLQRPLRNWLEVRSGRRGSAQLARARLECLLEIAGRFGQTLAVALLREVSDGGGQLLERRLRESLQPGDLLARWDSSTRLVGWLGLERQAVQALLTRLAGQGEAQASELLWLPADGTLESGLNRLERSLNGCGAPQTPGYSREVVLIEDDPRVVDLVKSTVEMKGLTVRWLGSLGEASCWMDQQHNGSPAQVVLLDMQVGDASGYELLKRMADRRIVQRHRVIVLTGAAGPADQVIRAIEAGAFDYLAKPFESWVLLSRLRLARGQTSGTRFGESEG
ncbi:MAG: response regulator [Vulcanimicrobiota bacterium]